MADCVGAVAPMRLIPPTAQQLEAITSEIELSREQHERDTAELKRWLDSQPHLPHHIDEKMLASFVVGCKNSLERAKQILEAYLTNRTTCPDFYSQRDPCDPTFRRLAHLVQYFVLPGMTPEGLRVSVFTLRTSDVSAADFNLRFNAIKVLSSYDVRFMEDPYWAGEVLILDFRHFAFKHLQSVLSPTVLKKYIHCVNQSLPVRYKKMIFINVSSVIEPLIGLVMRILKQKFVQRTITTTEDYPFLYNHLPREMLPTEYGGEAGAINDLNDAWQSKIETYRDWFLHDMTCSVDGNKRPEKNKKKSKKDNHSINGTFRSLSLD